MWLLMRLSLPLRVVRSTSMTSVAVHELIHGRRRPRVALLIDLIEQPHPYLLGFLGGVRPGGHGLAQVDAFAGERVLPGIDGHLQRTTRQPPDPPSPAGSRLPPVRGHAMSLHPFVAQIAA